MRKSINVTLEKTALDWIGVLFNEKKYFPYSSDYSQEVIEKIEKQLREVDENSLDEIVLQLKDQFLDEDKRREQIESKARVLQGFTALAGSLIIGFAQFLIGTTSLGRTLRILLTINYLLIAISLLLSIVLAQKAINTSAYRRPKVTDWLNLREWNKFVITRQYAADLYSSILYNRDNTNNKGTFLNGAHDWMRNTTFLLATLIVFLVFAIVTPSTMSGSNNTPLPVIVVTLTPTSTTTPIQIPTPTSTPAPLPTKTSIPMATISPSRSP